MQHIKYYLPGVTLILMGGLIIVVPEILVAIISLFIVTTGVLALYMGHGMRKSEVTWRSMDSRFRRSDWHRYCFVRIRGV